MMFFSSVSSAVNIPMLFSFSSGMKTFVGFESWLPAKRISYNSWVILQDRPRMVRMKVKCMNVLQVLICRIVITELVGT